MTKQTEATPTTHERHDAPPSSKLGDFLDKFNTRYGWRRVSGEYGDQLRDMQAQVTEDLPAALNHEDPRQAADQAQKIFEGDWKISDEHLKRERLAALHEIHLGSYGGEIPTDRKVQAWKDTQSVIRDFKPSKTEEEGYTRAQVGDAISTIFMGKGDAQEIENAIDLIETMINEENVLRPDGERLESLRITRDQLFERFDRELVYQQERQAMIADVVELVGSDNHDFPKEKIEALFGPRFADSAGFEEAQAIVRMALEAAASKDYTAKMELARLLMDSESRPKSAEEFEEWRTQRAATAANQAAKARDRRIARERERVAATIETPPAPAVASIAPKPTPSTPRPIEPAVATTEPPSSAAAEAIEEVNRALKKTTDSPGTAERPDPEPAPEARPDTAEQDPQAEAVSFILDVLRTSSIPPKIIGRLIADRDISSSPSDERVQNVDVARVRAIRNELEGIGTLKAGPGFWAELGNPNSMVGRLANRSLELLQELAAEIS